MPNSLKFYTDATLTTEITELVIPHTIGDATPVDSVVYIGSTVGTSTFQATSNPGVDPILFSIVDASPGSGHEAVDFKLALTAGGLDAATPGAALNLGLTINGGTGGAVPVYIRSTNSVAVVGESTEISLVTTDTTES